MLQKPGCWDLGVGDQLNRKGSGFLLNMPTVASAGQKHVIIHRVTHKHGPGRQTEEFIINPKVKGIEQNARRKG